MPPKTLVKRKTKKSVSRQINEEQLNEEIDVFLTVYNPYVSQNSVVFDQTSNCFKPIFDYKKPIVYYKNVGSTKRKLFGSHGIVYEEVPIVKDQEKTMPNRFNFRSVATQTSSAPQRDQNEYSASAVYPKFQGTASKSEIIAAYKQHEKQKTENEVDSYVFKGDLKILLKFTGRKEFTFQDYNGKYLRLCERILDQNITEANLDCVYYDNPSDEFKADSGSILPLWKLSCKRSRGMTVTDICWHPLQPDMLAVGHRAMDKEDEDDLGLVRERGFVCVFSLKGPSDPEKIIVCAEGVSRVSFHPLQRHLLAVACEEGAVGVCDLERQEGSIDSKFKTWFHQDSVAEIEWLPDQVPQKFCSLSHDGKLITWQFLVDDLFPSDLVTELKLKDWPLDAPPKGLEMSVEPKSEAGDDLGLNGCGTSLSMHPNEMDLFLASTESGLVQKGSFPDKQATDCFREHKGKVLRVRWNPIHPDVFISCATDYTIRVWDSAYGHSVFEFFFDSEIEDVAWAPYSSTVFAAITSRSAVSVFDLALNKQESIGTYTVYTRKQNIALTRISFNPNRPLLAVGDERGCVTIFKLSPNIRSSLKAMKTLEKSKFISGEMAKMDRLLAAAKVEAKRKDD